MEGQAIAKIKAHKKGGAANSLYIGSLRDEVSREPDRELDREPFARMGQDELGREMLEDSVAPAPAGLVERGTEEDRICGWNVPWFVADDGYGIWETAEGRALLESHSLRLAAEHLGLGPPPRTAEKLSVEEKSENLVAHFCAMAELEERRGGLSHFRLILSVGREVSIKQLKALVLAHLRENFPLNPAFGAFHEDTTHRHAHVYVQARQLNQRQIELGQKYFKLDESWMRICAEHLGDPNIYEVHMALKEKTREWSMKVKNARANGEPIPPKPDRWSDHHDTLLSFRPFEDRWCGRLQAQTRVAETKVAWLEAMRSKMEEVIAARDTATILRERLDAAIARRSNSKSEGKRQMPAEIITLKEAREIKGYERELREVEKSREANLRQPVASERTVTPSVISSKESLVARKVQMNFDFNASPSSPVFTECSREIWK